LTDRAEQHYFSTGSASGVGPLRGAHLQFMPRFLALVWNAEDAAITERTRGLLARFLAHSPQWHVALDREGLVVCCPARADDCHVLAADHPKNGAGAVIFGKLFDQRCAPVDLRTQDGARIVRSAGRVLIDEYWGQYVAFVKGENPSQSWVLRDPSGGVPCQYTSLRGTDVYFVRLEDLERLQPFKGAINRHYLLGLLAYHSVCVRETALDPIKTLLPGECIERLGSRHTTHFYWNPLDIAAGPLIEDPREAAQALRNTVRACVQAWASCFDGILHFLSGGLDSAIVLSCLTDAPGRPRVLCVNEYSAGSDADERRFARTAAAISGFDLIERLRAPAFSFESLRQFPRCPYPFPLPDFALAHEQADFARERGLQAAFSGLGGDELFLRFHPLPRSVDYAYRHPFSMQILSLALNDAKVFRHSPWRVLRLAARYGLLRQPVRLNQITPPQSRTLLAPRMRQAALHDSTLWHPLYQGSSTGIAPGKFIHAYSLTACTARGYTPGHPAHAPVTVLPLLSQPLMELSLRIPTDVLNDGNIDRTLARNAFAGDLPQAIQTRTTKGTIQKFLRDAFDRDRRLVREFLLEGFLVQEGFVQQRALRRTLAKRALRVYSFTELLELLYVEAWARSWISRETAQVPHEDHRTQ
jgi:asparagine synthase (glutamine-hydrolysing)